MGVQLTTKNLGVGRQPLIFLLADPPHEHRGGLVWLKTLDLMSRWVEVDVLEAPSCPRVLPTAGRVNNPSRLVTSVMIRVRMVLPIAPPLRHTRSAGCPSSPRSAGHHRDAYSGPFRLDISTATEAVVIADPDGNGDRCSQSGGHRQCPLLLTVPRERPRRHRHVRPYGSPSAPPEASEATITPEGWLPQWSTQAGMARWGNVQFGVGVVPPSRSLHRCGSYLIRAGQEYAAATTHRRQHA